jgi:hypothetical protein
MYTASSIDDLRNIVSIKGMDSDVGTVLPLCLFPEYGKCEKITQKKSENRQ